jgi:hypothetical protein
MHIKPSVLSDFRELCISYIYDCILSVFKLIQELSKNINSEEGNKDTYTGFAKLIQLLHENHKAKQWKLNNSIW